MRHFFLAFAATAMLSQPLLAQDAADGGPADQSREDLLKEVEEKLDFKFLGRITPSKPLATAQQAGFDTAKPVVGFGISRNEKGMGIDVVLPGSAAESAGLEVGMTILRINGITMKGFETAEVVKILGQIDGEITFDIEGRGRYSLIKAPIPQDEGS